MKRVSPLVASIALVGFSMLASTPAYAQDAISAHLQAMEDLSQEALAASQAAEEAHSVEAVKAQADKVFTIFWGIPSGLVEDTGAIAVRGWKVRWQTNESAYDEKYAARYSNLPPSITDPTQLGLMGRGRHVRQMLQAIADDEAASAEEREAAQQTIASLNNVIGWMRMDEGRTKGEVQPRVDLTYQWDAEKAFWLSTADTGWAPEAMAQAINILKADYAGDVAMAQEHAQAMTRLIEKYLNGRDANNDNVVEPIQMEGGLRAALAAAAPLR